MDWRDGVITQLPTHSNAELGNNNWGLGPSFVVLHLDEGDPWVYGVLVTNGPSDCAAASASSSSLAGDQ